jgi:hypothetical protein
LVLLGITSVVFLGLSPAGVMIIIFLSFIETVRGRGEEKRKLEVVVKDTTLGVGSRKEYIWFRRFPGSAR